MEYFKEFTPCSPQHSLQRSQSSIKYWLLRINVQSLKLQINHTFWLLTFSFHFYRANIGWKPHCIEEEGIAFFLIEMHRDKHLYLYWKGLMWGSRCFVWPSTKPLTGGHSLLGSQDPNLMEVDPIWQSVETKLKWLFNSCSFEITNYYVMKKQDRHQRSWLNNWPLLSQ